MSSPNRSQTSSSPNRSQTSSSPNRSQTSSTPKRILLAKTGLDCHDTGIVTVAQALREAGYEVIYLGLHNAPREVVKAAIEEDVDGIGVSYLSGQHMTQMRRLLDAMREQGCTAPIFCGGVIPAEDAAQLRAMGVAAVVPPGTLTPALLEIVAGVLASGPATVPA